MKANRKAGISIKYHDMELVAKNTCGRILFYLRYPGGEERCIGSHKRSGLLYTLLRNGVKVDVLRRVKPSRSVIGKKTYNAVCHLLNTIDSYACRHLPARRKAA